ncbi:MAG: hypothetical protein J6A59_13535, partial [Lachnospiraceae bacterium]|nr:hypothetical protein [Lachnospiraceae bacterium]
MKKENIKNIRKSIISMMVIMVMVITMVGCNKETTENTPNETIDETISSEITETTTEVVSEEVEDTKVEISRESIPCECCNGTIHYFLATIMANDYTTIPEEYKYDTTTYPKDIVSNQDKIYGKTTVEIDFYDYSIDGDFTYTGGYIPKDTNIRIEYISEDKDWVIIQTEHGKSTVKYDDIITNNSYVEVEEFAFSYEEDIEVAENDTSDSETTTENTSSNVQPEQPSNNEPETVQPTTEEPTTPPPSTPTTEEVVVEPTPEPTPTVTADQIVAEFNTAFTACGMQQMSDTNSMGYASIRCHAGNYVDQAWDTAAFIASFGTKYFYITISDNGDG